MPLLDVQDLSVTFSTEEGPLEAVAGVSFQLEKGETLGIVGESGSGKTVTSKSLMRIIPSPPGKITGGKILFDGEDLAQADDRRMQSIRGNRIAMIFQEPMTALNPVFTVGWQIDEALRFHQKDLDKVARRKRVLEMLELVKIPSAARRIDEYPHQLSGGMRQRVMIAMALACNPEVLIADEPTTALDVTIQAQVLRLIDDLKDELGTAVILITHDLGVVAEVCDRVLVMYAGQVVEEASIDDIFHRPAHPYTRALLRSIPKRGKKVKGAKFETIEGMVPDLRKLPPGCRFQGRCSREEERCRQEEPALIDIGKPVRAAEADSAESPYRSPPEMSQHSARCFFAEEVED
jgi:oligopeptide/dipeptide ABC transporter ATP-binding protein